MAAKKIGRNDPCPCGSGKKYKRCCMRQDQARRPAPTPPPVPRRKSRRDAPGTLADVRRMARRVMRRVAPASDPELRQLLETVEEASAYLAMSDEIGAASLALEDHRAEFEALLDQPQAVLDRVRRLFADGRFARLRFTVADVHRAFEAVGYPLLHRQDQTENRRIIEAAILYLADRDYRARAIRRLMMLLPEFVAAQRYLDAWLIQWAGISTFSYPDESNPFLEEMFFYGLEEWADQVDAQQEDLLDVLGIDRSRFAQMSADEVDARVAALMADPAKKARLEAYFADHPMLSDSAQAQVWEMEQDSIWLLERDDAAVFLALSPAEVQPWLPTLIERLTPILEQVRQATEPGQPISQDLVNAVGYALMDIAQEMVPVIFTPERIGKLRKDLKRYRDQTSDKEASGWAHMALLGLERDQGSPEQLRENRLLTGICFHALRSAMVSHDQWPAEEPAEESS